MEVQEKQILDEMMKDRRNDKVEEGREKGAAESDVTRVAVSGSRTSETEAEILSADVDDRRVRCL